VHSRQLSRRAALPAGAQRAALPAGGAPGGRRSRRVHSAQRSRRGAAGRRRSRRAALRGATLPAGGAPDGRRSAEPPLTLWRRPHPRLSRRARPSAGSLAGGRQAKAGCRWEESSSSLIFTSRPGGLPARGAPRFRRRGSGSRGPVFRRPRLQKTARVVAAPGIGAVRAYAVGGTAGGTSNGIVGSPVNGFGRFRLCPRRRAASAERERQR